MNKEEREKLDEHCMKCEAHHSQLVLRHGKMSKSHEALSKAHSDQTIATHHRDLALHHLETAKVHKDHQEHFKNLREGLAAGSGADVMDNHEDASRNLQNVYRPSHIDHLRAMRLLPAD
ncbi:MAG: hypothetical protein WA817_16495 [Candidatus Acidiferrum sp.]